MTCKYLDQCYAPREYIRCMVTYNNCIMFQGFLQIEKELKEKSNALEIKIIEENLKRFEEGK